MSEMELTPAQMLIISIARASRDVINEFIRDNKGEMGLYVARRTVTAVLPDCHKDVLIAELADALHIRKGE